MKTGVEPCQLLALAQATHRHAHRKTSFVKFRFEKLSTPLARKKDDLVAAEGGLATLGAGKAGKCANLSWKLKRLQTLWFDGIGRNNIKPVRERSRDEESVTFGEKTQEEASTG